MERVAERSRREGSSRCSEHVVVRLDVRRHGLERMSKGSILHVVLDEWRVRRRAASLGEDGGRLSVVVSALEGCEVEGVGGGEEGGIRGRKIVVRVVEGDHVHGEARFARAVC